MSTKDSEFCAVETLVDENNFNMWKFDISVLLRASAIDHVVFGPEKLSDEVSQKDKVKWLQDDAKAQKIIVFTIDKKLKIHILNCKNASEMYLKLESLFMKDQTQSQNILLEEFFRFEFDSSKDMATNLSLLENIVVKVNAPSKKIDDDMHMARILSILPKSFQSHFSTAWDSASKDEKTLGNLKARLLREEMRCSVGASENCSVAFKTDELKCFGCDSTSHFLRNCPNKKKNKKTARTFPQCTYCKKTNHPENKCFFRKKHKDNQKQSDNNKVSFLSVEEMKDDAFLTCESHDTIFVLDSAATSHMVGNEKLLAEKKDISSVIRTSKKGEFLEAKFIGKIITANCDLKDVLFIPGLEKNLLSIPAITRNGGEVKFFNDKVLILKDGITVLEGKKNISGLYLIEIYPNMHETAYTSSEICSPLEWHKKLGHLSWKNMEKLSKMVIGFEKDNSMTADRMVCEVCQQAKQSRKPFQKNEKRAEKPLRLIHTDLGEVECKTWDGKKYFMTVLDDYTHYAKVYLLSRKNEAIDALKEYIEEVERYWDSKVYKVRSDNGGEYISSNWKNWCKARGIVLDYTIPHTPQLNGRAERLNRTLMEKTRALLFESNLDKSLWGEALYTATFLTNRSPTSCLECTPAEKWLCEKPDLSNLKIFGSIAYTKKKQGHLKKLEKRSEKCIFVGYGTKGARLWDPIKGKVITSRDVTYTKDLYIPNQSKKTTLLSFFGEKDEEAYNENDIELDEDTGDSSEPNCSDEDNSGPIPENKDLGREKRTKKKPVKFNDYVLLTYEEATTGENASLWKAAIEEEKLAHQENQTWKLVNRAEARNNKILTSRWVFKQKDDGRFKARLVVRGCQQQAGVDYDEVFSPVVSTEALRTMIAYTAKKNFKMIKFDVRTAFLYGSIKEELYMELPEGYTDKTKICKLQKSLYGLRQAPAQWNKRITDFLHQQNFKALKTEQCVFINQDHSVFMSIFVDDGLISGSDTSQMLKILESLKNEFKITINENPDNYLGINLETSAQKLKLFQADYAQQVVEKYHMSDSRYVSTPLAVGKSYVPDTERKEIVFPYREAVGSILYLSTKTRPDLALPIGICGRHVENPSHSDVLNLKRILRYINGTKTTGISYAMNDQDSKNVLVGYSDADYAGDEETRRSTTGFIVFYNGGPISWASRRQPIVATSTTEAEYIAAAEATKSLMFLKSFLEELSGESTEVILNVDNQSAINLVNNGILNRKSKHIDVRFHYIKEKVDEGNLKLKYCATNSQIADLLTKPLNSVKFEQFNKQIVS